MATTRTVESIGRNSSVLIVTWGDLSNDQSGDAFIAPNLTDATVQFSGTFSGSAAVALQGSNFTLSPTWNLLSEPDGTLISGITGNLIAQILESPYQFRPVVTGGDGSTSIVCKLKLVGNGALSLNPQVIKVL